MEILPKDCPIVNADVNTLESILMKFLIDPKLRYLTGIQSRIYVEKYHDSSKLALELVDIFKSILNYDFKKNITKET
ncbi:MAG: hypothetical protein IPO85_04345 [Saprospiraceae bacterium]|uniref:Uncharacterized protein n=1 Tax=Candidatus Defluviibacterium haderslevense TaxID=2981993 RepID=A0A9D7XDJ7_9BACT|nr:hypothetical protein [Candidatus Defluviibacterium haderslevense]